jgi:hypothetical protein
MATAPLSSRESIKEALDVAETARQNAEIDRAILVASDAVTERHHRPTNGYRPVLATRYFDWPPYDSPSGYWRLWLNQHHLISVTNLTSGSTTLTEGTDFVLWPYDGPPYHSINILLDSAASFDAGDTFQRSLQVTGLWGHSNVERPAGATAEALDSTETAVDVTDGSVIGVGDVLRVDAERVVVTERTWLDSGTTLDGDLTSSVGERTVTVADGTALTAGDHTQPRRRTATSVA